MGLLSLYNLVIQFLYIHIYLSTYLYKHTHTCLYMYNYLSIFMGFSDSSAGKEIHLQSRPWFSSWLGNLPWRRDRLSSPVFLGFPGGSDSNNLHAMWETQVRSWIGKILWRAWQPTPEFLPEASPWTEEPGGLQSMRPQRVGHD